MCAPRDVMVPMGLITPKWMRPAYFLDGSHQRVVGATELRQSLLDHHQITEAVHLGKPSRAAMLSMTSSSICGLPPSVSFVGSQPCSFRTRAM